MAIHSDVGNSCAPGRRDGRPRLSRLARARRAGFPRGVRVEARCRDSADPTKGPDREVGLLGSDEREDPHARDSFTQKAVARFRISRSTSSSVTRRRSARFSADSADSVAKRSGSRCLAIGLVLLQPVAEARCSNPELTRDRGNRSARRSHERDRVSLELRRVLPALLSHRDSLRQAKPGMSGVHFLGGSSVATDLDTGSSERSIAHAGHVRASARLEGATGWHAELVRRTKRSWVLEGGKDSLMRVQPAPGPGKDPSSMPRPKVSYLANPPSRPLAPLFSATSAPNTVSTAHDTKDLHLRGSVSSARWEVRNDVGHAARRAFRLAPPTTPTSPTTPTAPTTSAPPSPM